MDAVYAGAVPQTAALSAYAARAAEYAEKLGSLEAVHPEDRRLISSWADSCPGKILDVGCGPGHWTDLLHREGNEVEGVDPVSEFVSLAQSAFPRTRFRQAQAEDLGVPDRHLGGILAWYSLIHMDPSDLGDALAEFSRALCPGGRLLIGFFEWSTIETFPHAVTEAYRWPVEDMTAALEAAGLTVEDAVTRQEAGARPHAALISRRSGCRRC